MTGMRFLTAVLLSAITAGQAGAVNLVLDYSYDTQGFFSNATAKATLEKAAADFSSLLTDAMGALSPVSPVVGQLGTYGFEYTLGFTHPGTGASVELVDEPIAANEYRIYAGGRSLSGNTLGRGGSGSLSYSRGTISGQNSYFTSEIEQINAKIAIFDPMIDGRTTQGSDFRSWGGSITFDTDASTTWHYDYLTEPVPGTSDLYSVAIHELAHAMGFGGILWESLVVTHLFAGPASAAANGGSSPATDNDDSHWLEGTMSTVLGSSDDQEAAMDPTVTSGTRKLLTELDAAGLADIGWQLNAGFSYTNPPLPGDTDGDGDVDDGDLGASFANYTGPGGTGKTAAEGDTDGDGDVDDGDLGTSFANYTGPLGPAVPEPASLAMIGVGGLMALRRRRD